MSVQVDQSGGEVRSFVTQRVRSEAETATWIRTNLGHWTEHQFGQWRLTSLEGEDLGRGGLRWIDRSVGEPLVEVGYVLQRSAWGNGYATEVCAAFIEVAATHYGIRELGAITLKGNDASTRVLEKCGFAFERWVEHPVGSHKFLRYRQP